MKLLKEVTKDEEAIASSSLTLPKGGWTIGHLAHHGLLLSCDGFSLRLDLDQLNALFDLAEDGESGEIRDHANRPVYVEVADDSIILSRANDETYPNGVVLDLDTLREIGIEQYSDDEPEDQNKDDSDDATIDSEDELKEGVKRAFRRSGGKIKRGFRVTSGFRRGRVVANIKNAYKPRAKASTRMKLKIASRKKKIIRLLKSRITRRRPLSKRLVAMNKRVSNR